MVTTISSAGNAAELLLNITPHNYVIIHLKHVTGERDDANQVITNKMSCWETDAAVWFLPAGGFQR